MATPADPAHASPAEPTATPIDSGLPVEVPLPAPDPARLCEILWRVLDDTGELVRYADAKAGALLAADVAIIGAVLSVLNGNLDMLWNLRYSSGVIGLMSVGGSLLVFSGAFCIHCITPRLKGSTPPSPLFFQDIVDDFEYDKARGIDRFRDRVLELDDDKQEFEQLVREVRAVSGIATTKYRSVKKAVQLLASGLVFGLLALLAALL